jgi:hypothetical protein
MGPGSATSDSIPAWVSNGEFVMRAAAVQQYGLGLMHALNSGAIAGAALPAAAPTSPIQAQAAKGFASGGYVNRGWGSSGGVGAVMHNRTVVQQVAFPDRLTLVVDGKPMTAFVRREATAVTKAYRRHDAVMAGGTG